MSICPREVSMAKTGLVSVSFRPLSAEQMADLCLRVQLPFVEWGSDVHARPYDAEALSRIARLQEKTGGRDARVFATMA